MKPEADQTPKTEFLSPNLEKIAGSGAEMGLNSVNSQAQPAEPLAPTAPESTMLDSELKPMADELRDDRDLVAKEEVSSAKEKEPPATRAEDSNNRDSPSTATASSGATVTKS